jgi:excisionase family DNA binding protein
MAASAPAKRKTPAPPRRYAPLADAAEYSRLSIKTLRRYIVNGTITGYRTGPKLLRVDLDELDRLVRPVR